MPIAVIFRVHPDRPFAWLCARLAAPRRPFGQARRSDRHIALFPPWHQFARKAVAWDG